MLAFSRSGLTATTSKLSTILSPLSHQISPLSTNHTLKMELQPNSKRPTCPSCLKPLALCLCTRLKTPNLDNKVHITILQHSLEKKHPLNSAKIAKLGLRNVDVFNVSDVMFDAQIVIEPLGFDCDLGLFNGESTPDVCENASQSFETCGCLEVKGSRKRGFDHANELDSETGSVPSSDFDQFSDCFQKRVSEIESGALAKKDDCLLKQSKDVVLEGGLDDKFTTIGDNLMCNDAKKCNVEHVIKMTVGKYGKISSVIHPWKVDDEEKTPIFEHLIASPEAVHFMQKGFMVKKLQKQQKNGSIELEQFEEFEIKVPPGSALLFPSENSVPVESIDFEVKNLVVLDGTWSKANRMYNENPWLRVLPCVRLDVEKESLFSEVRREPKAGYLSTIESIVYALKGLGGREILGGLDNLLEVLESMVEDQRRCKDERLRKLSSV